MDLSHHNHILSKSAGLARKIFPLFTPASDLQREVSGYKGASAERGWFGRETDSGEMSGCRTAGVVLPKTRPGPNRRTAPVPTRVPHLSPGQGASHPGCGDHRRGELRWSTREPVQLAASSGKKMSSSSMSGMPTTRTLMRPLPPWTIPGGICSSEPLRTGCSTPSSRTLPSPSRT